MKVSKTTSTHGVSVVRDALCILFEPSRDRKGAGSRVGSIVATRSLTVAARKYD